MINLKSLKTKLGYLKYKQVSYSQEGEDLILSRLLDDKEDGFYVDIGAHHPVRFSNTYFFYKKGWRGINIDAMPGSMRAFNIIRPRDINLETPVSDEPCRLTYYMFDEPALNGFSEDLSNLRTQSTAYKVVNRIELQTSTLADILSKNLPMSQEIDFMSIDVEGLDLQVLKSNDWNKFRPRFVLVEILNYDFFDHSNPILQYLDLLSYKPVSKSLNTWILRDCFKD